MRLAWIFHSGVATVNSIGAEPDGAQSADCQCPLATNRVIESLFKDTDFPAAFYSRAVE